MRRAEELSLRGGAGSTNALFSLREVAVTSRTLCPDPKKTRRRSVAGKGESMLESVRTDRSGSIGFKEEQTSRVQTMLRAALTRSASSSRASSCAADKLCLEDASAFSRPGAGDDSLSQ